MINFVKMQGLGNDFMMVDATRIAFHPCSAEVALMADRHFGVGFDQLLVIDTCDHQQADFGLRIFNADGHQVEQCGNGARCAAAFIWDKSLSDQPCLRLMTLGRVLTITRQVDGQITVDMGVPRFAPAQIPFIADKSAIHYPLAVADKVFSVGVVNLGNPHAVMVVDQLDRNEVLHWGPQISSHPQFTQGVNAGFMQIKDRQHITLDVYERGAGKTLACGSGACAAMIVGYRQGLLDSRVQVEQEGGCLTIEWQGEGSAVKMTGAAHKVFTGCWLGE